jgi:hypothetical protein
VYEVRPSGRTWGDWPYNLPPHPGADCRARRSRWPAEVVREVYLSRAEASAAARLIGNMARGRLSVPDVFALADYGRYPGDDGRTANRRACDSA